MRGCDIVFHLAANADVRHGLEHPDRDLRQNTIATFTVLEAMRRAGVRRIVFSSTGSVYGEPDVFPTPEDCPFPRQTSLYAASKLAGEGLIQAFCEGYGFTGVILRFVSIMGERYTHGHLFDFYRKLLDDPVAARRARRRAAAQVVPLRRRLHRRDHAARLAAPRGRIGGLQPRHRRGDRRRPLDRGDLAAHGRRARDRIRGRNARLGRRQPAHPPRLLAPAGDSAGGRSCRSTRPSSRRCAGSTTTPGSSRRAHDDDLHARAAAHQPRRRRHRRPRATTASTAASSSRARSTSTSTC